MEMRRVSPGHASLTLLAVGTLLIAAQPLQGCKSAMKSSKSPGATPGASPTLSASASSDGLLNVRRLSTLNLRVRRPMGAPVDPKAGPGGTDYRADPLPNEHLDCEKVDGILASIRLPELQQCLTSLRSSRETKVVLYRLRREHRPYLELQDPEEAPPCLRETLPRIPVARELFFQSNEYAGRMYCYASRLEVEANEILGVRLPGAQYELKVELPLKQVPQNGPETLRLISAWSLTPFFNGKNGVVRAKIVPDPICRRCIGEKEMLRDDHPDPSFWPVPIPSPSISPASSPKPAS